MSYINERDTLMNKHIRTVNLLFSIISLAITVIGAVGLAKVWADMPESIGIHFASDGSIDIFGEKKYALYPFGISLIALLICDIAADNAEKLPFGFGLDRKGQKYIINGFAILLDIAKLAFAVVFSGEWAAAVTEQRALNTTIPTVMGNTTIAAFILFLAYSLLVFRQFPDNEKTPLSTSLKTLLAVLVLLIVFLIISAIVGLDLNMAFKE